MLSEAGLDVRDLVVKFGGLVAVDSMSLRAPIGRITGLIGPNGAGKTTTFNACSGLVRANSGTVSLDGTNLTSASPVTRARRGLGRTFQKLELFDRLTARENVRMGCEATLTYRRLSGQLVSTRSESAVVEKAAGEAASLCGIEPLLDRPAGLLSTGQRRLLELATTLAGSYRVLLLDEPSSGLDPAETDQFGTILESVRSQRDIGLLLIEHDMALVSRVCEYLYVLDFGKPLIDGPCDEVLRSDAVAAAYLGTEAVTSPAGKEPAHVQP